MKKYRLIINYPSLFQKHKIGDIVYCNSITKNYVKAEPPHYSVSAYDVENYPDCWELIEEKKPLFTTEDGVQMFDRDSIVWRVRNKTLEKIKIHSIHLNECDFEHKVFAHESNADQYIWRNKRVFSYEDFIRWGNVPYERAIEQLAKGRIE